MSAAPEAGAATTSAPDSFPASRLPPEAARARTEELFLRHGRLVAGLCRGLLRNTHEAEDAAQQAFLSVHAAFMRGAEPDDPARWLAAIARNECLTRIRERMRSPLPVADAGEAASSADPVADAARRADIGSLWRAVGALAPQQREALLLREFGGMSYEELALALGVTVPAVESLLFRARTRLRAELRAVASALAGLLPRLFAGGGVAKVASVTVTAGLLTGGVVAGEHVLRAGPVPPRHAAAVRPPTVSPLSDLPPERAPAPTARRTTAPHRAGPAPAPSPPTVFAPSTPAPVLVSASKPSQARDASSGETSGQTETQDAPAPVREADDASPPAPTTTETPSADTTTTPTSADDGATTTTAATSTTTTTTAQDAADTGSDSPDGSASTDGGGS